MNDGFRCWTRIECRHFFLVALLLSFFTRIQFNSEGFCIVLLHTRCFFIHSFTNKSYNLKSSVANLTCVIPPDHTQRISKEQQHAETHSAPFESLEAAAFALFVSHHLAAQKAERKQTDAQADAHARVHQPPLQTRAQDENHTTKTRAHVVALRARCVLHSDTIARQIGVGHGLRDRHHTRVNHLRGIHGLTLRNAISSKRWQPDVTGWGP